MRTAAKPSGHRRVAADKRSLARSAELEIVDWDTRIEFPPSHEVRTIRARFVEVPDRPFAARPDARD